MSVVEETFPIDIKPAASKSVVAESLAQYNAMPHIPEINVPQTVPMANARLKILINVNLKQLTQHIFISSKVDNVTRHEVQN